MTKTLTMHVSGTPQILMTIPVEGILMARGTTKPADTATGYAKGCIFIDTDAAAGSVFFVNEGDTTSADFNVAL